MSIATFYKIEIQGLPDSDGQIMLVQCPIIPVYATCSSQKSPYYSKNYASIILDYASSQKSPYYSKNYASIICQALESTVLLWFTTQFLLAIVIAQISMVIVSCEAQYLSTTKSINEAIIDHITSELNANRLFQLQWFSIPLQAILQWRIQGEIPGCHGSPLSVYSYVALVQLLASYLSVFVAIVV